VNIPSDFRLCRSQLPVPVSRNYQTSPFTFILPVEHNRFPSDNTQTGLLLLGNDVFGMTDMPSACVCCRDAAAVVSMLHEGLRAWIIQQLQRISFERFTTSAALLQREVRNATCAIAATCSCYLHADKAGLAREERKH
jgi:hypothetical protein